MTAQAPVNKGAASKTLSEQDIASLANLRRWRALFAAHAPRLRAAIFESVPWRPRMKRSHRQAFTASHARVAWFSADAVVSFSLAPVFREGNDESLQTMA